MFSQFPPNCPSLEFQKSTFHIPLSRPAVATFIERNATLFPFFIITDVASSLYIKTSLRMSFTWKENRFAIYKRLLLTVHKVYKKAALIIFEIWPFDDNARLLLKYVKKYM